jgi:hypothetical protein
MSRAFAPFASTLVVFLGLGACNSDNGSSTKQPTDAGSKATPDSAATFVAFTGDCSSAKWAPVTDSCWSCLCGACKPKLDVCKEDCMGAFECARLKQTLVNTGSDIMCEIRATAQACLSDPKFQNGAGPLLDLDTCLIASPKPAGQMRACAEECGVKYPGDVCQRFPAAAKDGG